MICDIILIAILVFFALRGQRRGFVASVLGFFAVILSYVASALLSKPIADVFKNTKAYEILAEKVALLLPEKTVPEGFGILNSFISEAEAAAINTVADMVANIIIYVLAFIVSFIIIKLVFKFINAVFKLPGLNFLNRTAGFLLGAFTGLLLVYVVLAVWGTSTLFEVPEILKDSYIVKSMFENNLLFLFI